MCLCTGRRLTRNHMYINSANCFVCVILISCGEKYAVNIICMSNKTATFFSDFTGAEIFAHQVMNLFLSCHLPVILLLHVLYDIFCESCW